MWLCVTFSDLIQARTAIVDTIYICASVMGALHAVSVHCSEVALWCVRRKTIALVISGSLTPYQLASVDI